MKAIHLPARADQFPETIDRVHSREPPGVVPLHLGVAGIAGAKFFRVILPVIIAGGGRRRLVHFAFASDLAGRENLTADGEPRRQVVLDGVLEKTLEDELDAAEDFWVLFHVEHVEENLSQP